MIKNIVICGDSFSSADTGRPNTHFSELLSKMGYRVRNLARGGSSNTAICFQIQTAISLNADFVIFTSTGPDRLNIPVKKFNKNLGLRNFIYPYKSDLSSTDPLVGDTTKAIYSDTISTLLNPRPDLTTILLNQDQITAIKQYITFLHDSDLQSMIDEWIIDFWSSKIKSLNLKKSKIGLPMYDYANKNLDKINQAVYHTDVETQAKVASNIKEYIDMLEANN